ncbi:HNH endonuclease [Massilia oculi]|uniref:HNH endonuclease n=1 Tax=Massilia hydrophila TaxID=3044279 RepID=A0ABS7YCJ3_9BURK|nr:HNH endonuclease [Massilia oculi]MCA1857418.1 HNH endonuclease [Massilia oculi]
MTKSRGINRPKAVWTDDQLETLRRLYSNYRTEDIAFLIGHTLDSVYRKANSLGLKKTAEFVAAQSARQLNRPDHPARESRFQKGLVPWNKGVKGVAGVQEACRATHFRPGQQPHNTLPIGSTKFDKSGVLLQKVSNAPGNGSKRWRAVHELVWVRENGPVPPRHIVVFKPGMKTNVLEEITIDRVECISLAENMKRNTRHNLPPELNQIVQLKAVLTRQINKRMKHGQEEHR